MSESIAAPQFLRPIRSFVRRCGRLTLAQKNAFTELWPKWGLELCASSSDMPAIFGRQAPLIFEIGFGMGHSLVAMAEGEPDKDFIGVDVHQPGIANLLLEIDRRQLNNCRIFAADAHDVLKQVIPDQTLDRIQLFFPDPWPKKRHHKRRIVQSSFLELIHQKMKPGAVFHAATDWQEYADYMLTLLEADPGFKNVYKVGEFSPRPAERPLTKFEQRGQRLGHGVWDLIYTRIEK